MSKEPTQEDLDRFVRGNVVCCVSSLIHTLMSGDGGYARGGIAELIEEATELFTPTDDYEEAAQQKGYKVHHDMGGWYIVEPSEEEPESGASLGFDGREHYVTTNEAWERACSDHDINAYTWEIYEHWIVESWFAERLKDHGERVGECGGLTIWGRTTTGQAIAMDSIIETIWRELHADDKASS